jgi:predicted nuclease with TOPRIM domain
VSDNAQQLLVTLITIILGGGGLAAGLGYLKDRRIQKFSETQIKNSEALELDDRRILANAQALEVVERWNSRLESKVDVLQEALGVSEETNARLREENAVLREKVAQLEQRVERLQNHAEGLQAECSELRDELRKLANGGSDQTAPASRP